jgi:hypothetical protein
MRRYDLCICLFSYEYPLKVHLLQWSKKDQKLAVEYAKAAAIVGPAAVLKDESESQTIQMVKVRAAHFDGCGLTFVQRLTLQGTGILL